MKNRTVCQNGPGLGLVLLTVLFLSAAAHAQEGGMFSAYLVGTFDLRETNTVIQLVNPTSKYLDVRIVFFDDKESKLKCVKDSLSPNDYLEVDVRKLGLNAKLGVVKIVSMMKTQPYPGLVGFQRKVSGKGMTMVSESNLAAVPMKVLLEGELEIIMKACK